MSDYPDPTPEMLDGDLLFEAIWQAIKGWDISRHNDGLYSMPSGNDARHIYDAVKPRIEALEAALQKISTTVSMSREPFLIKLAIIGNTARDALDKDVK